MTRIFTNKNTYPQITLIYADCFSYPLTFAPSHLLYFLHRSSFIILFFLPLFLFFLSTSYPLNVLTSIFFGKEQAVPVPYNYLNRDLQDERMKRMIEGDGILNKYPGHPIIQHSSVFLLFLASPLPFSCSCSLKSQLSDRDNKFEIRISKSETNPITKI